MNIHDKLFKSMVHVLTLYVDKYSYEYSNLPDEDKQSISPTQFDEILDITNTDFDDFSTPQGCGCKSP